MSGWKQRSGKVSERDLCETIQAAQEALSEIARTKGLDGQRRGRSF
ncbi:hypothetical protein [Novosphingobium endophyticum]|nr:hypothetical protein [Novosphingobium endophyticum]